MIHFAPANSGRNERWIGNMVKDISATRAEPRYVKVGNFPGLYRNAFSGGYYGYKKLRGKRREVSLRTTDRKIAARRLREWMRNLVIVNRDLERTTLGELVQEFVAVNKGKSAKTQSSNRCIVRRMERNFPCGMNAEVRQIRASHLEEWLALHENRLKNTTCNRHAGLLKQLFAKTNPPPRRELVSWVECWVEAIRKRRKVRRA